MKNINKYKFSDQWESWINKKIIKHSRKPFKSGKTIATVKGITINEHSGKKAFILDDDSIIDCHQCMVVIIAK